MTDKMLSELTTEDFEIARLAIEDVLVDFRDNRIFVSRNNGLVIKERNGKDSSIIRLGSEDALRIGIKAIIKRRSAEDS
jgi:hypothetical protein